MKKASRDEVVSIRLRLEKGLLSRIELAAGADGTQKFIREAVLWRLDQEVPPVVLELIDELEELKTRVEYLENVQSTDVFKGQMTETVKMQVCRDDLDRDILSYLIQHHGATTPELADVLAKDPGKRRTIHDRIVKMNTRAKDILKVDILRYHKGEVEGKRGAWWVIDPSLLVT